jgi:type III secretion system low calcium response chaperone LcrH/SycD
VESKLDYLNKEKLSSAELKKQFFEILEKTDLSGGGKVIGQALGFSPEYFDSMYAIGVKYYENNRIEDAIKIFYQLVALEPMNIRNHKAMGACMQAKEDYEAAINIYSAAITLAAMDAEIHFYTGQCLFLTKQFEEAKKTFALVERICEKYPEKWAHIAQHAKDLHQRAADRLKK